MASQVTVGQHEEAAGPSSVLGKVQLLLNAFESGAYQLKLTELSRRSGVSKASVYRLAQEMVQWGLLDRCGDAYQLGLRIFELGQRVPASAVLRGIARPVLTDLFTATRATIHLAVLDGGHVLYLEKIAGEASIHGHSWVGGRLPATCTATGKVLLATSPEGDAQRTRLAKTPLTRFTTRTVASLEELDQQLCTIRARGYALEVEETRPGFSSLAVPVASADGVVYAAVSATESVRRLSVRHLLPELRATAAAIARAVGREMLSGSAVAGCQDTTWIGSRAERAAPAAVPGSPPYAPASRTTRAAG